VEIPGFFKNYLPPVPDDAQMVGPAPIGDRIIAALIDWVVCIVIYIPIVILTIVFAKIAGILGTLFGLLGYAVLLGFIYYLMPVFISQTGATIGKKMMKLRVVPEGNPTGRLELVPAILHQVGAWLLGFFNLIVILVNNGKGLSNILGKSQTIKVDR
jgi:uncharacterized RDD family membrane protein YckC